ncbi:MAG: flagellar assembly protein FliW [Eubacteriales bacterium]|nr:flagellar assembly protein FliW [Eubacteriales bacterium]
MKVETKWFGTIEVGDEKILTFDKGIIGFEDWKKYTLIFDVEKGEEASIIWLQAIDEPTLALPIMKPEYIVKDYDPIVEDEIINSLGENIKEANLLVFCALTVPEDLTKMTINLKAPIVINADTLKGVQLIADNADYQVKYPIYDILNEKDGE